MIVSVFLDNPFTQQKMKMWQPIMTPTKVVIIFMAIGVAFIPTGVSLIRTSNNVSMIIDS